MQTEAVFLLPAPADAPLKKQETMLLTRWLFLRLLGVIYLIAFVSVGIQMMGLVGSHGILPAQDYLASFQQTPDIHRLLPTLAWIDSGDGFLQAMWMAGVAFSVLAIVGVMTTPALAMLWVLYLSLLVVGQVFYRYQWDNLLLEVGFLAIFLAPLQALPNMSRQFEPSKVVVWLLRFLLFRLLFGSGYVKLASGDPNWHNLTALNFHYYTQPLPTPLAWMMQQLPAGFQQLSTALILVIELGFPFLILTPWRRMRLIGAAGIALLQVLILLTGNYTFFNWLTIALCVMALDDGYVGRVLPAVMQRKTGRTTQAGHKRQTVITLLATVLLILEVIQWGQLFVPMPGSDLLRWLGPFRTINPYGLFAVMTTVREEIEIEGSNDGETWQAYRFAYKPGDLTRPPPWVAPLQPRLDWQMWFAALGTAEQNAWFGNFVSRLLEGSPEVKALLEYNPFLDAPPRYIRARLYAYHFTDAATRSETGAWWGARLIGEYLPAITLR